MVTGENIQYVSTGGFITPKLADDILYRHAHPEPVKKATGLDWDALTPTCPSCDTKSGQIDATGLCPGCRGVAPTVDPVGVDSTPYVNYQTLDEHDVAARFNGPTQTPQDEATAPPTRASGSQTAAHSTPRPAAPTVRAKVTRTGTHDVLITLRSTAGPIDQVAVAALLNDLLTALHTQTPAAATLPAAAGTKSEGRTRVGKPTRPSDTPHRPPKPRTDFDITEATRLYLDEGMSCPMIAKALGCAVSTVQRKLKAAAVPMRDDRASHSGSGPKTYDTALVAEIRRLYLDEHHTIAEVAAQLGTTSKVVGTVMRRYDIPSRADAFTTEGNPRRDNAGALKNQIQALGVTARDIKDWALGQGLIDHIARGLPAQRLVDAYAAAHPTPSTTTTEGDTAA